MGIEWGDKLDESSQGRSRHPQNLTDFHFSAQTQRIDSCYVGSQAIFITCCSSGSKMPEVPTFIQTKIYKVKTSFVVEIPEVSDTLTPSENVCSETR